MKKITILSLFPKMISDALSYGIIKRASSLIDISSLDLRDWGIGNHKKVDDISFAPGPGMLFRPDVLENALLDLDQNDELRYIIHVSPRGHLLTNEKAKELAQKKHLIIIASRYEGVDQRFLDQYVDEEISIGDYILSGGELASLVLVDAILRMTGSVLRMDAVEDESFQQGLLEYPHYTKPLEFNNVVVPDYLRSGNHELIDNQRFIQQLLITWIRRPDLLRDYSLYKNINVNNKNPLVRIKKQNLLLKKRLTSFEKVIQEYKDVQRTRKHIY